MINILLKTSAIHKKKIRFSRIFTKTLIYHHFQAYEAGTLPEKKASAEDLIRLTKPITMATAKAVAAGNSCRQEDVIVCANTGRKAIFDLLGACRVGTHVDRN